MKSDELEGLQTSHSILDAGARVKRQNNDKEDAHHAANDRFRRLVLS